MSVEPQPGRTPRPRRAASGVPWIAMYHSVGSCADDPYRITVSPDRLAEQLRWMRRNRLRGVGVGELLAARAAGGGRGLVGLTFDDGYTDFLSHALPLLRRCGFRATVFVLPGRLGGVNEWDPLGPRKPLLTAEGIREAHAAGMEIASHGLTHIDLTGCDEQLLRAETVGSRTLLSELVRAEVSGFCYPYGTVDARVAAAVRRAGYRYACAIDPGRLSGPFALPRLHIGQQDTPLRMALKRRLHPLRRRAPREEAAPV
ncbi:MULTISPECIES: polysaccharide deacetylase family protein [Streptomyces]|uniref:Polysaccharide deacetylase n=2 Tax=Streptomyces TaxID=1883 RepID=A0A0B5EW56_STRA4|nr:polysaccharide deacetylase family protein [Streptomyces sp. SCSIO ZS0520]AJE83465.1 polysaccharide deacetylase [Streptomyces albus]AOU77774.1 polysaccharide deacetylase [Streptomyces albus]AYN33535.1 polysaccharide deacetylase [Streptomyces albus]